jgi:hypothetical protein
VAPAKPKALLAGQAGTSTQPQKRSGCAIPATIRSSGNSGSSHSSNKGRRARRRRKASKRRRSRARKRRSLLCHPGSTSSSVLTAQQQLLVLTFVHKQIRCCLGQAHMQLGVSRRRYSMEQRRWKWRQLLRMGKAAATGASVGGWNWRARVLWRSRSSGRLAASASGGSASGRRSRLRRQLELGMKGESSRRLLQPGDVAASSRRPLSPLQLLQAVRLLRLVPRPSLLAALAAAIKGPAEASVAGQMLTIQVRCSAVVGLLPDVQCLHRLPNLNGSS